MDVPCDLTDAEIQLATRIEDSEPAVQDRGMALGQTCNRHTCTVRSAGQGMVTRPKCCVQRAVMTRFRDTFSTGACAMVLVSEVRLPRGGGGG